MKRFISHLFLVVIFLLPTVKFFSPVLADAVLVILFIVVLSFFNRFNKQSILILILILPLSADFSSIDIFYKIPLGLIAAYWAFVLTMRGWVNNRFVAFILFSQFILSLLQTTNATEIVYTWNDYANDAEPFTDVFNVYLPQIRPSGFFVSPTYFSYFLIVFFVFFYQKRESSLIYILYITVSIISGSTLGLLLSLCASFAFSIRIGSRILILFAVLAIYFALFPEIAAYNIGLNDFFNSVVNRDMSESIFVVKPIQSIIVLTGILTAILLGLLFIRKTIVTSYHRFFYGILVLLMPILLHDANGAFIGYYISACGLAFLLSATRYRTSFQN